VNLQKQVEEFLSDHKMEEEPIVFLHLELQIHGNHVFLQEES